MHELYNRRLYFLSASYHPAKQAFPKDMDLKMVCNPFRSHMETSIERMTFNSTFLQLILTEKSLLPVTVRIIIIF